MRDRQPWKAAYERDYGWPGALMAEHYAGDDSNVQILAAGILAVDYTSGAEQALEQAGKDGWTVVSVKNDWATVF